jgi:hypothetical protein
MSLLHYFISPVVLYIIQLCRDNSNLVLLAICLILLSLMYYLFKQAFFSDNESRNTKDVTPPPPHDAKGAFQELPQFQMPQVQMYNEFTVNAERRAYNDMRQDEGAVCVGSADSLANSDERIKKNDNIASYPLYKTLKKYIIDTTKKYDRTYSKYNKFNTIYNNGIVLKGKQQSKIQDMSTCCIAIDVSGSVSGETKNRIIDCLYGVVRRIGNNTRIALIYWSENIVASSIIDSNTKKRDIFIPSGGGTDIQCLFNKELQNVDEPVMALLLRRPQTFILTDGGFGNFNVCNDYFNKATWLIHSNTNFDPNLAHKLQRSKVVYLDYL